MFASRGSTGLHGLLDKAHKKGLTHSTKPTAMGKMVADLRSVPDDWIGDLDLEVWQKFLDRDRFLDIEVAGAVTKNDPTEEEHNGHGNSKKIDAEDEEEDQEEPPPEWAVKLRALMEDPASSRAAVAVNVVITVAILLSFVGLLLKPIVCDKGSAGKDCRDHPNFFYPDVVLCVIFTVEYVSRLIASIGMGKHELIAFVKEPTNTFDILAVMPTWLNVIFGNASGAFLSILRVCRFLKLARIIRMMRLTDSHALQQGGSKRLMNVIEPSTVVWLVIWAIFMKETLSDE